MMSYIGVFISYSRLKAYQFAVAKWESEQENKI